MCNVETISMKNAARLIYQHAIGNPDNLEFITLKDYVHDVDLKVPSVKNYKLCWILFLLLTPKKA